MFGSRLSLSRPSLALLAVLAVAAIAVPALARADWSHAIAMHGEPHYPAELQSFPYADPDAPKGGKLTLGVVGSFDSLNPFVVQGTAARGLRDYVFESLMARGLDEPFTLYGLLAERLDVSDDRGSATFELREQARFSDGEPVTADDVLFSWEILKNEGRPNYRTYYSQVEKAQKLDERTVRFSFAAPPDREMPLILGLMPVLPKHVYENRPFDRSSLAIPVGSGPYQVGEVKPGSVIVYRRNPDYWGGDLPVNRGRYNFDEIVFEYYRNDTSLFEAFKKGLVDVVVEESPSRWARDYTFPAVEAGKVVLDEFESGVPRGMSGLVFNTRRPMFADRRVREAILALFDGDWVNQSLYHGLFRPTASYFDGSELSARGTPASGRERDLLMPWPDRVSPDVLEGTYDLSRSDGSGRDRTALKRALELLGEAGYALDNGVMTNVATGERLAFEILVATPDQERLALTFVNFLKRAGIAVAVRQVDSAQFERRRQTFDFDMIPYFWFSSLSPGNEQKFYWGSEAASAEGSRNYMGVADPAIDAMIAAMLSARSRPEFVDAVRALDRILISGTYVVPLFHLPKQWVARWSHIGRPEASMLYGYDIDTWWDRTASERGG